MAPPTATGRASDSQRFAGIDDLHICPCYDSVSGRLGCLVYSEQTPVAVQVVEIV